MAPTPDTVSKEDKSPDSAAMPSAGESSVDSDKTRTIFRVAARIFSERGFHATSINEIAEAVQLTKAGLYYYIKGKGDLLFRIMDHAMETIEEQVVSAAEKETDPERRLEAVVRKHAALVTQPASAPFAILVDELSGLAPELREKIAARQKRYVDFIRQTLHQLEDDGKLRPNVDCLAASYALLGMVLWSSRWYRQGGKLDSDQVADQLAAMALNGLLKQPAPAA